MQEADYLAADDASNLTRRIAAAAVSFHDPRPFVGTKYGQVRRQFDAVTPTERAREFLDLAAWSEGEELRNPDDVRDMHLANFACSVNGSTMTDTLTGANGEDVIDAIIRRGRANR